MRFTDHFKRARPLLCTLALAIATQVAAETTSLVARDYQLTAGPLGKNLSSVAVQAGIPLSFDTALTLGKNAPVVSGHYTPVQALEALLNGSGLQLVRKADGSYTLQAVQAAAPRLATVAVSATEGTGSYTTNLTNTATKLDMTLRETPQSVTVMTHKRIEDQGLDEVSKVLDQTTGIYFNNTNVVGGDSNVIYSRGFEMQNYQVNGVPRSHRFGFKNDISDTVLYDRVEVVRGASGLLNGVGEPAGAVNLVRKLPTREFQAHVAAKVGSWDYYRAEGDVSGSLTESGNVRGRLVVAHQDNGSVVDRVDMQKDVLYGIIEAELTPATIVSAGFEYQQHETTGAGSMFSAAPIFFRDGSRTGFGPSTNLAADWSYTRRDNLTLFAGLEHYFDNGWKLRADAENSQRKYDITIADVSMSYANPGNVGSFRGFKYYGEPQQNSLTLHATGPYQLFGRTHELVIGGSYYQMEEDGKNFTRMDTQIATYDELFQLINTGYYPRGNINPTGAGSTLHDTQSGFYAATRLSLTDAISLLVGGRVSNWETRTDRFTANGTTTRGETSKESAVFTPYTGIVVDLTDYLSVYASYTDIFQPATRYDESGNLLDPAEGNNLEAGVKLALLDERLNISTSVYQTKKDNVPEYVPGLIGPNGGYVYKGVDGTETTGFELDIAGELTANWQVAGGFSYNKPEDSNGNPRLTYIPNKTFKLFSSYQPRWLVEGLTLGVNLRWQDAISATSPYPVTQGSFATLDLMALYDITRKLSATLNVNNLTDKRYHTNINGGGWYGEPRSANLNLRYKF